MDLGKFWDKYGLYVALLFMMLMMVSYSIEWLRVGVGQGIDVVFDPLVDSFKIPFFILIVILSALTGLYSSLIQKYTIDYDRMTDVQERMKDFQKEYREAQLSQDEKKIKKLDAKRDKVMKEQLELSQQQFKPMAFILVLTVPIFFWLLFRLNQINTTITLPYLGVQNLTAPVLWVVPAWMIWYFICSVALSQVIRKALNIGGL
ncbi:MAG: EMC3/TMCO1 family protein [Methanoregula sp.]|jgi:uncharacterized membrane protein (DUF106 family)|nr:EMC3/TMCO1 family protein [Methanoregula sp.]MDD5023535.1 EMC3/TMCO1 family protein [Methanoregula sp.]MDD5186604.1 EMC3/TMCO1 family protein [Methanoregula sp.]